MSMAFFLILAGIAGSYAWAMRGTLVGGQKGCYQPGALLGMLLAYASGVPAIRENFWIFAALGAAAMFFGGTQTYGDTIGFTYREDAKSRRWGRFGLFLKGANWFGIYGGLMGIGFGAMAGKYTATEMILLTVSLPIATGLGILLLNMPYKPEENKYAKLYFSYTRGEVWGGMLFVVLDLLIFSIVKGEMFGVWMTVFGYLSGGFGFWIGNQLQTATHPKGRNGKFLFGKAQKNGFIESWKCMEFTLGAVGGIGTTLAFLLFFPKTDYAQLITQNGLWTPLKDNWDRRLTYIWLLIFVAYTLLFLIAPIDGRAQKMKAAEKHLLFRKRDDIDEILVWPVYSYLPIALCLLGSVHSAIIFAGFVVYWLIAEDVIFSHQTPGKYAALTATRVVLLVFGVVLLLAQLFTAFRWSAWQLWVFYYLSYEIVEDWKVFAPQKLARLTKEHGRFGKALLSYKGTLTVRGFSLIEIVVALIMGYQLLH